MSFKELFYPDKTEENGREAQEIISALKEKMSKLGGEQDECI